MPKTLQDFKSAHNPDQEIVHLRSKVTQLERRLKQEKDSTGEARLLALELTEAIESAEPVKMVYKPSKKSGAEVTHVLHLTDLHEGEVTIKDEVDGFGEFNPEIFKRRLEQLGSAVIHSTEAMRGSHNITRLQILGTGDYISGDIHEELKVTNAHPAPVQAINAGYGIGALVEMLAPHFGSVNVDMITLDNHGRMTKKNQAAQGGENNWGYVVAHAVKKYSATIPNVKVNIHAKASALVPVGPEKYLLFHGHQIKGWAGLPYYGFDRRVAMESVKRLGFPESPFTKLVMGHFHVAVDSPHWLIGGSLSGTNAFDHACGRHSPAHQTSWLVHDVHGHSHFTRWWLK